MIWSFGHFFVLFWMLKIMVYFKACFREILTKLAIFYAILTLNLVKKFIFEDLAFFETAYDQICFFNFFGPGNPGVQQLLSLTIE